MSDLPNFKRSWIRRLGLARVVLAVVVVVVAAIALGFSEDSQGVSVRFINESDSANNGESYTVKAVIKNDDVQTARVEIQGVLYAAVSSCLEKGKHLTMSIPINVNVAPNATVSTDLHFDVSAPCKMSAGMKAFVNGTIDNKRFSTTEDSGILLEIL